MRYKPFLVHSFVFHILDFPIQKKLEDAPRAAQYAADSELLRNLQPVKTYLKTSTTSIIHYQMRTFGLVHLKIRIAPVRTKDNKPRVKAFQVLSAISAKASGTRTAVLNFNPNKNGTITFLTIFERPEIYSTIKCDIAKIQVLFTSSR